MRRLTLLAALALLPAAAGCEEDWEGWVDDIGLDRGEEPAAAEEGAAETPGPDDGEAGDPRDLPAADEAGEAGPWVRITSPGEGESVPNPVTFLFAAGGGVATVQFSVEGWKLHDEPLPASSGSFTYDFTGVNRERAVLLEGLDGAGGVAAADELRITPTEEGCVLPAQEAFNRFTVEAINDLSAYPKDGTYPYCWSGAGDTCNGRWGMVYDGVYAGQTLFPGGGDCFCSGHTLEIFLRAYRLWQTANGVAERVPFTVGDNVLTVGDVDIGDFYQHWQGFGVADDASAADAFEYAGIGAGIGRSQWEEALTGDYVNLSRSTGSGHAVIFVGWVRESGQIAGLRYYGCNGGGHSCPDPDDPDNTSGNSGPSFVTERFEGHGGHVLPEYLFIGRVFLPTGS